MRIEVHRGDITELAVDAIVNAANDSLRRGGGVCGAIFAGAGPDLDVACAGLGGCATGDAVVTPGFDLPAAWIVHAVGPVWRGGGHREAELLARCYRRSLEEAVRVGARSIAFPAISTGIYGYPADDAADVAVTTLLAAPTEGSPIERVVLVAFDQATADRYERRLATP